MLKAGVVKVALLPAVSVTVTCLVRPAPSPLTITGLPLLVVNTPDKASTATKGTLTSVEFQPLESAAGEASDPKVSVGATESRRTVTERVDVPPADVAVQVNVVPGVSEVTSCVPQPECEVMNDSLSIALSCTVTLLGPLHQPFVPGVPDVPGRIIGGVLSPATGGMPLTRMTASMAAMYSRPLTSSARSPGPPIQCPSGDCIGTLGIWLMVPLVASTRRNLEPRDDQDISHGIDDKGIDAIQAGVGGRSAIAGIRG